MRLMAGGFVLAVVLAACSQGGPPPPCPAVVPVADAAQMVRFNGRGRDLTDVLFEAKIENYGLTCEYNDNVIESQLLLKILAVRGPADRDRSATLKYFVAIATRDQEIGAREEFDLAIPFEGNNTRVIAAEELTPRIPLKPDEAGDNYLIYIGLVITPEELQYNRENR
ncbi:MAG TPA: hypothetical protein VIK47_02165 [Kiloniellales bacterium]